MTPFRGYAFAIGLVAIAGAIVVACSEDLVTTPDPSTLPTVTARAPLAATGDGAGGAGETGFVRPAATNNGLRVEIIRDDWDAAHGSSCHSRGGVRGFKLTNESAATKYSRQGSFHTKALACGTQDQSKGVPREWGCTEVAPGETCEYFVEVAMPECGSDQHDNCWGPGDLRACSFVYGDSFRAPDPCEGCVEKGPYEKCGGFGECHKHEDDGECYEHAECKREFDCKDPEEFEKKRPCQCECVEGGPYKGEIVWSGEVPEGSCPDVSASTGSKKCHELGTQKVTWDCRDPSHENRCRPADCPKPEGLCHVSNKGNDRNMSMVITRHGHPWHTDRCPPDLRNSQCSCANVIAAAESCNPGATNYSCRDNR